MKNDLMDFVFESENISAESDDNSLFSLLDSDVDNELFDFSLKTSESIDPEVSLFTEAQDLNIIED